ncbi:MAG: hypothetical protein QG585_481 [Patescibacteria group bacterium]|jgi:HSP20 family protein|nr:hypothetical protein [Patescibacteria group bacterium]
MKKSFFSKLKNALAPEDVYEEEVSDEIAPGETKHWIDDEATGDGELTVDLYETRSAIIIKTMVAGVKKENLEVELRRDMITIKGKREVEESFDNHEYFHKELYWGSFSRSITLPQEVDINLAEATESQGLLTIRLPKVDKERQTKLKVKSI